MAGVAVREAWAPSACAERPGALVRLRFPSVKWASPPAALLLGPKEGMVAPSVSLWAPLRFTAPPGGVDLGVLTEHLGLLLLLV